MKAGLVSISFRKLTVEEVCAAAAKANLSCIEWGSDVHAPRNDAVRLAQIVKMQNDYGITCCSYGTYFYLGADPIEELPEYIQAAKTLNTNILRLWCGKKSPQTITAEEKATLFDHCKRAAQIAEVAGVILCLEAHRNTYTETKEGALELMEYVNSPAFQMYYQPNQFRTVEENIQYARLLAPYTYHLHVFQWKETSRFPLSEGIAEWQTYLKEFSGEHALLLEFMPDDDVNSLPAEASALHQIIGGTK